MTYLIASNCLYEPHAVSLESAQAIAETLRSRDDWKWTHIRRADLVGEDLLKAWNAHHD